MATISNTPRPNPSAAMPPAEQQEPAQLKDSGQAKKAEGKSAEGAAAKQDLKGAKPDAPAGTAELKQKGLGTGVTAQFSVDGLQKLDQAQVVTLLQSFGVVSSDFGGTAVDKSTAVASFEALKSLLGAPPKGVKPPEGFASVAPQEAMPAAKTLSMLTNLLSQSKLQEFLQTGESKDPESWKALIGTMHDLGLISGETPRLTSTERERFSGKMESLASSLMEVRGTDAPPANLPAELAKKLEAAFPQIQGALRSAGLGVASDKDQKQLAAKLNDGLKKSLALFAKLPASAQAQMARRLASLRGEAPEELQSAFGDRKTLADAIGRWMSQAQPDQSLPFGDKMANFVTELHDIAHATPVSAALKIEIQATFTAQMKSEFASLFLNQQIEIPPAGFASLEQAFRGTSTRMGSTASPQSTVQSSAQRMGTSGASFTSALGVDMDHADVTALIMWVMGQCRRTDESIVRDQMKDMMARNKEKKELRDHINHMKSERAEINKDQRSIYDTMQSNGVLKESVSFSDFQSWCPVSWDENGNASITSPLPPLPASLRTPKPTEPEAPAISMPPGVSPLSNEQMLALAEKYGISPSNIQMLYAVYSLRCTDGVYIGKTLAKSKGPISAEDFEKSMLQWESLTSCGLKPSNGDPAIADKNNEKIEAFHSNFNGTIDKQLEMEQAAHEGATPPASGAPTTEVTTGPIDPTASAANLKHSQEMIRQVELLSLMQQAGMDVGSTLTDLQGQLKEQLKKPMVAADQDKLKAYQNGLSTTEGSLAFELEKLGKYVGQVMNFYGTEVKEGIEATEWCMEDGTSDDDNYYRMVEWGWNAAGPVFVTHGMDYDGDNEASGDLVFQYGAAAMTSDLDNEHYETPLNWPDKKNAGSLFDVMNSTLGMLAGKGVWMKSGPMQAFDDLCIKRSTSVEGATPAYAYGGPQEPKAEGSSKPDPKPTPVTYGDKLKSIANTWNENQDAEGNYRDSYSNYQGALSAWESNYDTSMNAADSVSSEKAERLTGHITQGSNEMFNAAIEDQEGKLDTLSELTATMQMRLQQCMDQISKLTETMSNIMKKIGETQGTLAQNLK